jgi:hypothetical protein
MPIRRLATPAAYSPEQIAIPIGAHKAACTALGAEPADTIYSEAVARKILECAAKGEFESDRLCAYAVRALRNGSLDGARLSLGCCSFEATAAAMRSECLLINQQSFIKTLSHLARVAGTISGVSSLAPVMMDSSIERHLRGTRI